MGMRFWTGQTLFSISRRKGTRRRWRERWPPKINSKWGKHCCCWFGQKRSSNGVKNDIRIFENPQTVVLRILKQDLRKRKLCARFDPHSSTSDKGKIESNFAKMADADNFFFFNKIIAGDEIWCFACEPLPPTKRQSSEWVGETSPRPKKLKFQRSRIKTMLINFRLSRRSAQRIRTRGKNSKCRIS